MTFALIFICLAFVLLILEAGMTRRSVNSIPVRIHVNGTRGKSSITAYLTAALRAEGWQVLGKVTGEIPELIGANGTRTSIRRRGPARISEQFRIIRRAALTGADALVLECMSIDPALQETESTYFRPKIYVLSNIRDDHREKMGRTREEQVAAMCRAIPRGCILLTGERENLDAIRAEADRKRCRLVVPEATETERLISGDDSMLPSGVFPENIALAAEAAVLAGVRREVAIGAILGEIRYREENAATIRSVKIPFLNAFAVNDPASATVYLDRWKEKSGLWERLVLIFNTRSDRPARTEMFSEWILERRHQFAGIYITGDHRAWAYAKLKVLRSEIVVDKIGPRQIQGLSRQLSGVWGNRSLVVGIGNINGAGYRVIKEFGE